MKKGQCNNCGAPWLQDQKECRYCGSQSVVYTVYPAIVIIVAALLILCVIGFLTNWGQVSEGVNNTPLFSLPKEPRMDELPWGPTFQQAEVAVSDRITRGATSIQQQEYDTWRNSYGANTYGKYKVQWEGILVDVDQTPEGFTLELKCNPDTWTYDTRVYLDHAQYQTVINFMPKARVTFIGVLSGHDHFGYTITNARVVNYIGSHR